MADKPTNQAGRAGGRTGGWAAFTDNGAAPGWVTAARCVLVVALAATIPTILGVSHGNRLLWTIAIASLPFFWMVFGYHLWRRICPLAVAGQLGRLLGRPGTRKMGAWMTKNYLLVQLALMLAGLSLRLCGTNGSAAWLAVFLAVVVALAIATSFAYAGKTWCNFLCPVGLVEKIHTEPARAAIDRELTSQCGPCVACKRHCPDIDLEQGYWKELADPPRRIAYFAWPGIVVAFYTYYYLVAGDWDYYFSGRWAYDGAHPWEPGFTFAPAIPVAVAAPLTLIGFGVASFVVFAVIERIALAIALRNLSAQARDARATAVHHAMLAVTGLIAFNAFYLFAGRPSLERLPAWVVAGWSMVVVFASTAMFVRRLVRSEDKYVQEKFAQKILKKWEWGDAPPSDELKDIYLLHTERTKQREARLRAYKETVREMVADGTVTRGELVILDSLRAQLGITDKDHTKIVGELTAEERQLFDPAYQGSVESRLAREQYRKDLERVVIEAARGGALPARTTLAALREDRGVTAGEEAEHLAHILAPDGPIAALYRQEVAEIERLAAVVESTAPESLTGARHTDSASVALVRQLARTRARERTAAALGLLGVLAASADGAPARSGIDLLRSQAAARKSVPSIQVENLAHIDPSLRQQLADQLRRIELATATPLSAPPILAVVGDSSRHLRAAVAVLLSRFEDDRSREALVGLIDDPAPIVREATVRALGAKSRLTRELLTKVLADPERAVRNAAIRAVSGGTTEQEMPALDPNVLAQTTKGIGQAGAYATLDANAAIASLTVIEKMMLIRQVPMFEQLAAEDLEELALIVEERRVDPMQDVFREGDPGDAVYLIVKGRVRVFVGGDRGDRPERVLSELGDGACIGEMAVLDAAPRSATVRAIERTRTLRVPGDGFKRLLGERPEMSEVIVTELVRRMRSMMGQGPSPSSSNPAIPVRQ